MQHEENFIQSIGRQITNTSAEKIVLSQQENFTHIRDCKDTVFMQAKYFKEERTCDGGFQTIKPIDTGVKFFIFCAAFQQKLIGFCIFQQILQECFGIYLRFFHISLEGDIDLIHWGDRLLFDAEIIPYKKTHITIGANKPAEDAVELAKSIKGVSSVSASQTADGLTQLKVSINGDAEIRPVLIKKLVDGGFDLYEAALNKNTLEDVFHTLTEAK